MSESASTSGAKPGGELTAFRAIVEGTAHGTGDEFFRTLVRHLADVMGVGSAIAADFVTPARVRTLA